MILQSLVEYYNALAVKDEVPRPGWTMAKVSFALNIDESGELINITPLKKTVNLGKKTVEQPILMEVPQQYKRAAGIISNFMCDNSTYLLGIDNKGKIKRTEQCFQTCRELHTDILQDLDSPTAKAVISFLRNWNPQNARSNKLLSPYLDEIMAGSNLVFIYKGKYAHEDDEIRNAWETYRSNSSNVPILQCLVTGKRLPIAILHPSIKGVKGAQSSGASLVSFNARAYESYGRKEAQGLNAPVSVTAAFAYGTALNYLLADKEHLKMIGDTSVVFWAEDAEVEYQNIFGAYAFEGGDKKITEGDLKELVQNVLSGRPVDWNNAEINYENTFFILGLAPNAARLSVRFFLKGSFGSFISNLEEHYERLEITRPAFDTREYLFVNSLLNETVNQNSRDKTPSPILAGATLRAILSNTRYPASLFSNVMLRIRADKEINRGRAAIIKAYLIKNFENKSFKEVLTVALNDKSDNLPYLLGREFAVLERIQNDANPNINTTIKDKYFNSACATPSTIFPILEKLKESHIRKLEKGHAINFERLLGEIKDKVEMNDKPIPTRLSLEEQGVFILGYYHQRQKFYQPTTKKKDEGGSNNV
jgi:CRISPR-associated protein Csd1